MGLEVRQQIAHVHDATLLEVLMYTCMMLGDLKFTGRGLGLCMPHRMHESIYCQHIFLFVYIYKSTCPCTLRKHVNTNVEAGIIRMELEITYVSRVSVHCHHAQRYLHFSYVHVSRYASHMSAPEFIPNSFVTKINQIHQVICYFFPACRFANPNENKWTPGTLM